MLARTIMNKYCCIVCVFKSVKGEATYHYTYNPKTNKADGFEEIKHPQYWQIADKCPAFGIRKVDGFWSFNAAPCVRTELRVVKGKYCVYMASGVHEGQRIIMILIDGGLFSTDFYVYMEDGSYIKRSITTPTWRA